MLLQRRYGSVLGYWGKAMRDAGRNTERWKRRRTPTQDPGTKGSGLEFPPRTLARVVADERRAASLELFQNSPRRRRGGLRRACWCAEGTAGGGGRLHLSMLNTSSCRISGSSTILLACGGEGRRRSNSAGWKTRVARQEQRRVSWRNPSTCVLYPLPARRKRVRERESGMDRSVRRFTRNSR